jgi:hypothetical protein
MKKKLSLAIFSALAFVLATDSRADGYSDLIAKYGKPDRMTSSDKEKPKPLIITRLVEYKKEGVRFILVPEGNSDVPQPYLWKLFGAQDIKDGKNGGKLSNQEVAMRLEGRKGKSK